jgi:hypothetical protein
VEPLIVIEADLPVAVSLAVDVQNAVGVDVEGDLDLRNAARRRRRPPRLNSPRLVLSAAIGRSPW